MMTRREFFAVSVGALAVAAMPLPATPSHSFPPIFLAAGDALQVTDVDGTVYTFNASRYVAITGARAVGGRMCYFGYYPPTPEPIPFDDGGFSD